MGQLRAIPAPEAPGEVRPRGKPYCHRLQSADFGRSRRHEPAPSFVPKQMVQSSTAALSENPSLPRSGECSFSELAHQGATYYFWDWTSVEGHGAIRAASGVWRMARNDIVLLDSLIAKARR
jgi:hypothetical protein